MATSHGNACHITGSSWGKSTGECWIPITRTSNAGFWCLFDVSRNQLFHKHSSDRWFEIPYRSADISVMLEFGNTHTICGHYRNQSLGCLMRGWPLWPPIVPQLAARSSQSNPRGSGPEVMKRERGHVTSESGVSEVGVFRALQPNAHGLVLT